MLILSGVLVIDWWCLLILWEGLLLQSNVWYAKPYERAADSCCCYFSDKRTAIIAILFDAIAVWMLLLLHVAQFKYLLFTVNSMKWSNARCFVFFLNDDNMLSLIERFDSMLISMNMIKMGCPKIQFFEVLFFHRWEVMALHWVGPI